MNPAPSSFHTLRRGLAGVSLGLLLLHPLAGQTSGNGEVTGRVSDEATRALLASAEIVVEGTELRVVTGRDGEFTLRNVPAGDHTLVISYLGLPTKRVQVTVLPGQTAKADAALGDAAVQMGKISVEATRTGQARALNQQRASQTLTNVVSSDLTGQFPDKTIADAVKRLPGITVETDTDTGGSEGRYITIRGMSAAFNAVSVNGVRVGIANADDSISRQVPLDVISAKSADTIVVSKTLRPDQDGDSIGGAVDIQTRSALDRDGPSAFVEGSIGYRSILEDYDRYRYENPNYEGAFSYSTVLGADRKWAVDVSGNARAFTSQKHRASVYDWIDISETTKPAYLLEGFILQDFFDHLEHSGLSTAVDFRPADEHKFRLTAAYNLRATERGRQRELIWFDDEIGYSDFIDGTPKLTGDTYTNIATTYNSFTREVREFHEKQSNLNLAFTGESKLDGVTLTYLAGFNRGQYKGDPDRDIWARFQTSFNSTNSYTIQPGNAYFPTITTSENRDDPSLYMMRSVDLSTDVITDEESNTGLDAKFEREIAGHPTTFKIGGKARLRGRDRDYSERYFGRNRSWRLTGYGSDTSIPSLVAPYKSTSFVEGHYDLGFYIDPGLTRATALKLIDKGVLVPDTESDAFNSKLYSYSADEDVLAAYAMNETAFGKFTILSGLRAEKTKVQFHTQQSVTDADGDTTLVAVTPSNSYTDLMPGLHLRYDLTPRVALRAAYTHTISRPTFSDLNPRAFIDREELVISRGRIDLKPITADNLDLSADYYLGSVGYVSASVFYKKLRHNIYTPDGIDAVIDGETYTVSEPRNAEGGHVAGIELGYEQQFKFLPAPFDGLGFTTNWTHADSKVKTGLAVVPETQLFDQVKDTVNAGIFYEKGAWRARLSWLYRSSTVPAAYGINQTNPEIGRVIASSDTLDLTASYRFAQNWTVFAEAQNLLNTPGRAYDGDQSLRLDYNEYTDWSAQLGLRWNL